MAQAGAALIQELRDVLDSETLARPRRYSMNLSGRFHTFL
jgi:hypothetical protein